MIARRRARFGSTAGRACRLSFGAVFDPVFYFLDVGLGKGAGGGHLLGAGLAAEGFHDHAAGGIARDHDRAFFAAFHHGVVIRERNPGLALLAVTADAILGEHGLNGGITLRIASGRRRSTSDVVVLRGLVGRRIRRRVGTVVGLASRNEKHRRKRGRDGTKDQRLIHIS